MRWLKVSDSISGMATVRIVSIVAIDSATAGDLRALSRWSYNGSVRPVTDADILAASITTRDIDRRGHEHFLDKELHEAPDSMRKTLRGRIASVDGALRAVLGHDVLLDAVIGSNKDRHLDTAGSELSSGIGSKTEVKNEVT